MKTYLFVALIFSAVLTLAPPMALAQSETDSVVIEEVEFKQDFGNNEDTVMIISLKGKGGRLAPSGRNYLDDITVMVYLGYEVWIENKKQILYFSSSLSFTSFEADGFGKEIAFWLPEDVANRYKLNDDPKYWAVELKVGERAIKTDKSNYRSNVSPPMALLIDKQGEKVLTNFVRQAAASKPGILKPTYLTTNSEVDRYGAPAYIREK